MWLGCVCKERDVCESCPVHHQSGGFNAEQFAYLLGISQMKLYEGGAVLVLGVFTKGISCHGEMSLPPPSRKWTL